MTNPPKTPDIGSLISDPHGNLFKYQAAIPSDLVRLIRPTEYAGLQPSNRYVPADSIPEWHVFEGYPVGTTVKVVGFTSFVMFGSTAVVVSEHDEGYQDIQLDSGTVVTVPARFICDVDLLPDDSDSPIKSYSFAQTTSRNMYVVGAVYGGMMSIRPLGGNPLEPQSIESWLEKGLRTCKPFAIGDKVSLFSDFWLAAIGVKPEVDVYNVVDVHWADTPMLSYRVETSWTPATRSLEYPSTIMPAAAVPTILDLKQVLTPLGPGSVVGDLSTMVVVKLQNTVRIFSVEEVIQND